MDKDSLIKTGERLLSSYAEKDIFNIGSLQPVLPDALVEIAKQWEEDMSVFILTIEDDDTRTQMREYLPILKVKDFDQKQLERFCEF